MAAGLDPDSFWRQSPRSFISIMEGRARAAKREADAAIALAWHIEAFARQKRLQPLTKLLGIKPKQQTTDEMLTALQTMAMRGAPMTFREIN